jgi:hypothetical protein
LAKKPLESVSARAQPSAPAVETKRFEALDVDRSGFEKSCTRSPNLGRIKGGGGAISATARLPITGNDGRFALQPQA